MKRFLGWQKSPASQASFGRTTKGGSKNTSFDLKHSTGSVASTTSSWFVVDASEAPLGRVATTVATLLMGKHLPTFTRGADSAVGVIVVNASKAYLTANKAEKKTYYRHSGYMGGIKQMSAKEALLTKPEEVIWTAVQGMLPKNRLSRYQIARLKIYRGADHPHATQKPKTISVAKTPLKNIA